MIQVSESVIRNPLASTPTTDTQVRTASLKAAAAIAAKNSRALYPDKESWFVQGEFGLIGGNQNNGYYWWEAGAWFGVSY